MAKHEISWVSRNPRKSQVWLQLDSFCRKTLNWNAHFVRNSKFAANQNSRAWPSPLSQTLLRQQPLIRRCMKYYATSAGYEAAAYLGLWQGCGACEFLYSPILTCHKLVIDSVYVPRFDIYHLYHHSENSRKRFSFERLFVKCEIFHLLFSIQAP